MYFDHIHFINLLFHFTPGYSQNMISILLLSSLFYIFKNHLLNTISATFIHTSVGPPLEQSNLQGATPSRKIYFPSFCSHQLPISPQLWMGFVSPSWYTKEFLLASSCQVTTTAVNPWVGRHVTSRKQHVTALLPILLLSHSLFRLFPKVTWTWGGDREHILIKVVFYIGICIWKSMNRVFKMHTVFHLIVMFLFCFLKTGPHFLALADLEFTM